jgi:hypothetical protein
MTRSTPAAEPAQLFGPARLPQLRPRYLRHRVQGAKPSAGPSRSITATARFSATAGLADTLSSRPDSSMMPSQPVSSQGGAAHRQTGQMGLPLAGARGTGGPPVYVGRRP